MFTNIKKLLVSTVGSTSAAVYTAPVGFQAQITRIKVHNTDVVARSLELRHNHATNNLLFNLTIAAGDTVEITDEWQLAAGEAIFAKASSASVINIYIAGREDQA